MVEIHLRGDAQLQLHPQSWVPTEVDFALRWALLLALKQGESQPRLAGTVNG